MHAGKKHSMRQIWHTLSRTAYNGKPQVAPAPHPPVHSSFITWLCLLSPCGPFSDWMNWKGWRFELNKASHSHSPTPHLQKASHPPLIYAQPIVSSTFLSAEGLSSLCGCFWNKKEPQRTPDLLYVRIISIIHANSPDSVVALYLTFEELTGSDEIINGFNIITKL